MDARVRCTPPPNAGHMETRQMSPCRDGPAAHATRADSCYKQHVHT